MAKQPITAHLLRLELENGCGLEEALLVPEVVVFTGPGGVYRRSLTARLEPTLSAVETRDLHRRIHGGGAEVGEVVLELAPPGRAAAWDGAVELAFHYVRWEHGETHLAYLPALGVEVYARSEETLLERLGGGARRALVRRRWSTSIRRLALLARHTGIALGVAELRVERRSPLQEARRRRGDGEDEEGILEGCIVEPGKGALAPAFERAEEVRLAGEALAARHPRSVLLVGPSGAGKTAVWHELVRTRAEHRLAHTPCWETNGSRLISGMGSFGQWQERCQKLVEKARRLKAVLALGNLVELMEVGRHRHSQQGIADFLLGAMRRGEFLAVAECTPEQFALIESSHPHLLNGFEVVAVEEPEPGRLAAILAAFVHHERPTPEPAVDAAGIAAVVALHRRFATYSASPGRPLRFLRNLLRDHPKADHLPEVEITRAFARESGLPAFMLDESAPFDAGVIGARFRAAVAGQEAAVEALLDLLHTVRARLNRPGKPIATLLFIGPTGVGKTELAKALAEFFYGDRNRMVRLDLSEYAEAPAVRRLVGAPGSPEGLLTAKVRDQPFSVVLLDEFEKAHPDFFDLLLQVAGEGRLTDGAGRVADFSSSVVIMTSNLGAASFRGARPGFDGRDLDPGEHFTAEVKRFLRPELFNRIDAVLPFAPLTPEVVRAVAAKELAEARARPGLVDRGAELEVPPEVLDHLAAVGYDARYGARPLKRALESRLLVPVAEVLNNAPPAPGLKVRAGLSGGGVVLTTEVPPPAAAGRVERTPLARLSTARRRLQALEGGEVLRDLANEVYRLRKTEEKLRRRRWVPEAAREELWKLKPAAAFLERAAALSAELRRDEADALTAHYLRDALADEDLEALVAAAEERFFELLCALETVDKRGSDACVLGCFAAAPADLLRLAKLYVEVGRELGATVTVAHLFFLPPDPEGKDEDATWRLLPVDARISGKFFDPERVPGEDLAGVSVNLRHPNAAALFQGETGFHLFKDKDGTRQAFVIRRSRTPLFFDLAGSTVEAMRSPAFFNPGKESLPVRCFDLERRIIRHAAPPDAAGRKSGEGGGGGGSGPRNRRPELVEARWRGTQVVPVLAAIIRERFAARLARYYADPEPEPGPARGPGEGGAGSTAGVEGGA